MLAEFLNGIVKLAAKSEGAQVVKVDGDPSRVGVRIGDKLEWRDLPARLRAHQLRSFNDLVNLARDSSLATAPEIYHSPTKIDVLLDRNARREVVSLPLARTNRFESVVAMDAQGVELDPPEAVRLLRFQFNDCGVDKLIGALRRIDFTRAVANSVLSEHGREHLGKSVEARVQQADQVPETFDVGLNVFSTSGLAQIRTSVRFGLHLDASRGRIFIKPLADEVRNAIEEADAHVHLSLIEGLPGVPVFAGELKLV